MRVQGTMVGMRVVACALFLLAAFYSRCQVIELPRNIDGLGRSDVTNELNSFLNSVPNNSKIKFPRNRIFKVEGILRIKNKVNLEINGNGSSIVAETTGATMGVPEGKPRNNWPRSREHLSIERSHGITISNLTIKGPHVKAGLDEGAYHRELEAQHGVNIYGSTGVILDSLYVTNVYGDCIYVGDGAAKVSTDSVVIQRCFLSYTGRQGIAITHANTVIIMDCEFSEIRRTHIDLEGNTSRSRISNVIIKDNIFRKSRLNWISAAGKGETSNVYVIANTLIDKEANVTLGNVKGAIVGPFYFIGNKAFLPMGNPHGAAWRVINVDGFFAFENQIAFKRNRNMYLVGQYNSTNIILKNNSSETAGRELKDL